jgi:hypothetical protein
MIHEIGAFILGKQPVSVDTVMTRLFELNPQDVSHLVKCSKYGLGLLEPNVIGEKIEDLSVKFNSP